ncbi:MAG: hypothetical protein IKZ14_09780 [Muribaculaceae bacterium]|nr:hypothetical protein [Muribaculaceae bacterium]
MRGKIVNIIDEINNDFINNSIDFEYQVFIFPDGPTENAGDPNTQATINNRISTSDIFILLVEDGMQLGAISYQELMLAHDTESQSAKSIVCYVIRKDGSAVSQTTCDMGNNEQCTIDQAMNECGNRYARYVEESSFKDHLCGFLKSIITGARFKQSELNYTNYIHTKPNQIFRTEPLYFRRDIDEEITNILNNSSLIVLEGQPYCGKTRAAFNLMINNEQWTNRHFYIIQGDHADALSRIDSINTLTQDPTVVLIDDINMAFGSNDLQSINPNSLTSKLKILQQAPNWENLIVIITVSGKIDAIETHNVYSKLFGDTHSQLLNDIRVNFNTNLTRQEFYKLVSELRQEGLITDPRIYPGNYTIGSLFINERELIDKIANASKDGGDVFLHSLKTFFLVKKSIKCDDQENDLNTLKSIFNIAHKRLGRPDSQNNFDSFLKKSHSDGLVFVENDPNNNISAINVDNLVLDKFNFKSKRIDAIKDLIDFAANDSANQNMILQYGFWVLSYNELTIDETEELIKHICKKFNTPKFSLFALKKECQQLQHLDIFCATALAEQVFNNWTLLDKLPTTDENLYKDTLVALLHENLKLSKIQKENVLNKIFSNKGCIFSDEDLKNNIFALKRLSPHFIKKGIYTTSQILVLAENATIVNCQSDACDDSDFDPFEISDNSSSNSTNNDDGFLLIQIGKVIHELLKTTSDYTEFEKIFDEINKFDNESKIKQATQTSFFDKNLHYLLVGLAKKYPYPDKYKLFIHIFSKSPAFNPHLKTVTLNKFLPLLDEHDALSAFNEMTEKNIFDKYTLPFLFKNRLLGFEQLLSIVNDDDNKDLAHFITLNQLLDKADTQSDAISCFRLMKVKDLKPENLKDESALGSYIKIKDITAKESIEALKAFKINNKYAEKNKCISQSTLGKIIQKSDFDFDSLYKLLFNDIANNEVIELLGLSNEEAKATQHNQYCYNFLYKKNKQLDKSTADDIFNKTPKDLIYNDEKSSIIAEYAKNSHAFPNYSSLKNFFDAIKDFKHTPYTYKSLLYRAINSPNSIDDKINNVNSLLIDAYNYFADKYPEDEVIEKMAYIYHMRLELVRENDFDKVIKYPYEEQIIETTFEGYLEHILNNEPRYASGTFIFRTLVSMNHQVNESIYNIARKFASINRVGISIDSLNNNHIDENSLHKNIINKILKITVNDITIDSLIIADYSHIKMLWWLLENNKISVEQAESSRKKYKIDVTQTYLNILFKKFSQMTNRLESQDKLIERWKTMLRHKIVYVNNKSIYFSIQMAVAMLKTAKKIRDNRYWDWTISYLSDELNNNSPEILDLKISRLTPDPRNIHNVVSRWEKIVDLLRNYKDIVNTTNINSCLAFLHLVKTGRINNDSNFRVRQRCARNITQRLWDDDIKGCLKINLYILINSSLNNSFIPSCDNNLYVNADVRTFAYYTEQKETYQIIKEHFNNSLFYDKKKDCLKDFLKNLSQSLNYQNNLPITLDNIKNDLYAILFASKTDSIKGCLSIDNLNQDIKNIIYPISLIKKYYI